ncbi:MAG: YggS family pyridoxal phosphate-dependent enzyme [Caldilineaceae bacterium]
MSREIVENLAAVRARIGAAAQRPARSGGNHLGSRQQDQADGAIEAAYAAGHRDFGENRLEELWRKVDEAKTLGLDEIRWHMIGTIQSRKTKEVIGPFALVHSVDRAKIAERLSRDATDAHCVLSILLEVNVSGETSKHGFTQDELLATAEDLLTLPAVTISGLMTMAPFVEDPEETRPVFRGLRELRDALRERYPAGIWQHLSMGMTNDFEVAVEEGATLVRVGSAIFGER